MRNTGYRILIFILLALPVVLEGQSCWSNYRGDARLSGVSGATLPRSPELLWNFATGDAVKSAPVVCDEIIVAGSVDGNIYGITMDGKLKWKINTANGVEAPALISDGTVYLADLDGRVLAIELQTGKTRWTYTTDGMVMGAPNIARVKTGGGTSGTADREGSGGSTPSAREKEVLVIGSYDYYLHGIDAATGKGLWKYEADNFINGTPAIFDGLAVFGGCDGLLHQVHISDGSLKERKSVATYVAGSVAVDAGITWVGDYDGKFTCMDLHSGEELWSFSDPSTDLPFIASPAVGKKHVYIGSRDKYVYCFDKMTGKLVWKVNTRGRVDASPVLAGEKLVVANMRGDVMILDVADGRLLWSYELGSAITGNPAVIDGYIIAGAADGRIYCFGGK